MCQLAARLSSNIGAAYEPDAAPEQIKRAEWAGGSSLCAKLMVEIINHLAPKNKIVCNLVNWRKLIA